MKPLIGITAEVKEDGQHHMPEVYTKAIIQAGGIPLLIPLIPEEDIDELCERIDGLFVTEEKISIHLIMSRSTYSLRKNSPQIGCNGVCACTKNIGIG